MAHPGSSPASSRRQAWARLGQIYHKEIWRSAFLRDRSLKGYTFALLRVISITATVFNETRVASRAAALSFSSLLGLGPLLAIAVLVAGFALGKNDPNLVANTLNRNIKKVAPQIQQYEILTESPTSIDPKLVNIIDGIIAGAQSGSAGAFGGISLLLIVLLMFKSIEDAFNDIWGVRQGRSILMRVVFYWTILTLGAVLFFTAIALLSANAFMNVFADLLPGGAETLKSLSWALNLFSLVLIAGLLALFYRMIPNTRVFWRPAIIGSVVVSALLMLNSFVSFLYVKRVVLEKSLYGSLAILPVLMLGLYVFWLYVLIGGIVSYAIQNVQFRNSQAAWSTLTERIRERLALVVFLTICRRFRECLPPVSASHLSEMLNVPAQLLNECLNRLVQLNLVATLSPDPNSDTTDYLYQPAKPLNRTTLFDFKTLDDNLGEELLGHTIDHIDPLLSHYDAALQRLGEQDFFQKSLEQLLEEHPFGEPPHPQAAANRPPI